MSDRAAAALVIGVILGAAALVVLLLGSMLHGRSWRQRAWIATGIAGMPMAAVSSAYLVGLPYMLGIAFLSLILARWRQLDHGVAMVALLALVLLIGAADYEGFDAPGIALWVSAYAMTVAAAKLGRMAGRAWLWRDTVRAARVTPASLP